MSYTGQADCILDGTPGNCINFRYCTHIVSLIVQINQKKDDAIENYIRRAVCGFDNLDPLVCKLCNYFNCLSH